MRQEAEKAGFRPCKRCKPDQPSLAEQHASRITRVCRLLEQFDEVLNHRVFKAVTGLTPNAYAAANRTKRVRAKLTKSHLVTEAIYDTGFNSNGRSYETSNEVLGMTPSEFRPGGSDADIFFAIGECSLGSILVAKSKRGVCAILLGNEPTQLIRDLQDQFSRAHPDRWQEGFDELVVKVIGFIEQPGIGPNLPLDIRGTAFQQRVWRALRQIPVGSTASYAEIAEKIGRPKAVRAQLRRHALRIH